MQVVRALARGYRNAVVGGRWLVLLAWTGLVVAVLALVPVGDLSGNRGGFNDLLPEDSPAVQAAQRSLAQFAVPVTSGTAVVLHDPDGLEPLTRAHGVVRALAVLQEAQAAEGEVPRNRVVGAVPIPLVSADTQVTYLFTSPDSSLGGTTNAARAYADHFTEFDVPGVQTAVTGFVPAQRAQADVLRQHLHTFELASLGLVVLIVALIFRSALASVVVLAVAAGALLVYFPLLAWIAERLGFAVPQELQPVLAALLIGVVTDYCVLFFHAFRDALAQGRGVHEGVRRTMASDSPVVAIAGITVAVGTLALLVSPFGLFAALGPALAFTVLVGAVAALVLTPALMAVLGHKLFRLRGRVPVTRPLDAADAAPAPEGATQRSTGGWLSRALVAVLTHRAGAVAAVVLVTAALLLAAAPLRNATLSMSFSAGLPPDDPVKRGAALLADAGLAGLSAPTEVLVEGTGVVAQRDALARLQASLATQPGVVRVIGPADLPVDDDRLGLVLARSGDAARFVVVLDSDPLAAHAIADVRQLRSQLPSLAEQAGLTGVQLSVTGQTRIASEVADLTVRSLFITLLVAFALQLAVLALYLRSLVTPLVVLTASLVSMGSALGLTVLVFQDWLGQPGLTFYAPFATAVLLLALGADYSVFALGGIWEEARRHPLRRAIAVAVPRSAGAITAAGVILASTFALVALIPLVTFRQIAFTMAVGLLIDTLLVRPLLMPAVLVLLGRWAGWPGRRTALTEPDRPLVAAKMGA